MADRDGRAVKFKVEIGGKVKGWSSEKIEMSFRAREINLTRLSRSITYLVSRVGTYVSTYSLT